MSPDAGTASWLWISGGLAMGFALLAAGVPLSSVALFGLLADVAGQRGVPWWVAGIEAGVATILGHGASYLFFAHFGQPALSILTTKAPHLLAVVDRLRLVLAGDRPWLALLALRWIGLGYAQLFWLLATMGINRPALLGLLFLNDLVWALVWTYGAAGFLDAVPWVGGWLTTGAALLLILSAVGGAWAVYRQFRRSGPGP